MTANTRNLLVIEKDISDIIQKVRESTSHNFSLSDAQKCQALYLEMGQRFQDILISIQNNVKKPLENASIGMNDIVENSDPMWDNIEIMADYFYFNIGKSDEEDIPDLAKFFIDDKVPQDVHNSLVELISLQAELTLSFGASHLSATEKSISLEYHPQISQETNLSALI